MTQLETDFQGVVQHVDESNLLSDPIGQGANNYKVEHILDRFAERDFLDIVPQSIFGTFISFITPTWERILT